MVDAGFSRRRTGVTSLLALLAMVVAGEAEAQTKYPERPVRIIVPFVPGGIADVTTRLVGEKLGTKLGQRDRKSVCRERV